MASRRETNSPIASRCAALALLVALAQGATARDRPGTPADVKAWPDGPTAVNVSFTNTASRDLLLQFEMEVTANGERFAHAAESYLSKGLGWSGTGTGWGQFHGMLVRDLTPQTQYCFRFWSRVIDSGVRSGGPSAWGCAVTPPHPPLAPLDVKAQLSYVTDRTPRLTWNTPDQSGWRGIDRYVIERQSPPGPNRPWILEKTIAGPGGAQTATTRLAFSTETSAIRSDQKQAYRVCAENDGGRTCAKPVELSASIEPRTAREAAAREYAVAQPLRAGTDANAHVGRNAGDSVAILPSPQRMLPRPIAATPSAPPPRGDTAFAAPLQRTRGAEQSLSPQPLPPNANTFGARIQDPPATPVWSAARPRTQPEAAAAPASSLAR